MQHRMLAPIPESEQTPEVLGKWEMIDADGESKIGGIDQWICVREPGGQRGYVATEYVKLA